MPPVKRLAAAGVRHFCANDNIRDAWSPFGNGDMLERVGILCDRQDFRSDKDLAAAFRLATQAPAEILGHPVEALQAGSRADFVILPAASLAEAVATVLSIVPSFAAALSSPAAAGSSSDFSINAWRWEHRR